MLRAGRDPLRAGEQGGVPRGGAPHGDRQDLLGRRGGHCQEREVSEAISYLVSNSVAATATAAAAVATTTTIVKGPATAAATTTRQPSKQFSYLVSNSVTTTACK